MADTRSNGSIGGKSEMPKDDDIGKLFIGGINWGTTEASLKDYMSKYGEVEYVELKRDTTTNKPRGFGFVKFRDEDDANKVLMEGPHIVDGKAIDPKKASPVGKPPGLRTKKIFVGGLKQETTEDELRKYFGNKGDIVNVEFITERGTDNRRGFCFVEFEDEDIVDHLVKEQYHVIAGKRLEVKHAYSKEQQAALIAKGMWPLGGAGGRGRGIGRGFPPVGSSQFHYGAYPPQYLVQHVDLSAAYAGAYGASAYPTASPYAAAAITYPGLEYPTGLAMREVRYPDLTGRTSTNFGPVPSYTRSAYHPYSR